MMLRFLPSGDEPILQKESASEIMYVYLEGLQSIPVEIPGRRLKIPVCGLGEIPTGYLSSCQHDHWNHCRRTNRAKDRTLEKASMSHCPIRTPCTVLRAATAMDCSFFPIPEGQQAACVPQRS